MHCKSIYVLILNYQSYSDTITYVENLQKQQQINLNILIVDNCSPNDSFSILSDTFRNYKDVKVIKSDKNGGYAYGNNYGLHYLKNIKTDYILVSNNDIKIQDSLLLYRMIKKYETLNSPGFVSPLMYVNGRQSPIVAWKFPTLKEDIAGSLRIFGMFNNVTTYDISVKEKYLCVDCLPGSFFMARKEIFYEIGLMDEKTFLYMEEAILAYKIKDNYLNNYLLTDLKYEHMTSQTISNELSSIKMRKHLIDSRLYFHKAYLKTNIFARVLLKFLFYIWILETFIYVKVTKSKKQEK